MADLHANFATSLVATAPSPATSGTSLVVTAAEGARFPTAPFNAVICPAVVDATPANAEVVRVTARSTDTLTITRAQESSTARTVVVGDRIYAAVTNKTLTDIEGRQESLQDVLDTTNGTVLTTAFDLTSPQGVALKTGTFTPSAATVFVTVSGAATNVGLARAGMAFYWGPTTSTPLTPTSQGAALGAGVHVEILGAIPGSPIPAITDGLGLPIYAGANPTPFSWTLKITGLTPGTTYAYALTGAIVGGGQYLSVKSGAGLFEMDISKIEDIDNYLKIGIRDSGDIFYLVRVGNTVSHPADSVIGSVAIAASGLGDVEMCPSGRRAVVTNLFDLSAQVIDTSSNTANPTVLAKKTFAAGTYPLPVCGEPLTGIGQTGDDSTAYVWIGLYGTGEVVRMKVSDQSLGTAVAVGSASSQLSAIAMTPDKTYVLAALKVDGKLGRMKVSDSSVTLSAVLGGGSSLSPTSIAISPDGTTAWVGCYVSPGGGTYRVYPVTIATMAVGTPITTSIRPFHVCMMPDGKCLLAIADQTGSTQLEQWNLVPSPPVKYTQWGNSFLGANTKANGAVVSKQGGIYMNDETGLLNRWDGSRLKCRGDSFTGEQCRILFQGAT